MSLVDAVLFDADGVIQRVSADVIARLTVRFGIATGNANAFLSDIFAAEALSLTGSADFEATISPVFEKWNAPNDPALFRDIWHTIDVDRSVLAVVAELRRTGTYCALASNQEQHRARYMSVGLSYGSAFDREFYSCHLGHAKPSVAYFAEIVNQAGLDPMRTLFIDDRDENVSAARCAGLYANRFELEEVGTGGEPLRQLLSTYGLFAQRQALRRSSPRRPSRS